MGQVYGFFGGYARDGCATVCISKMNNFDGPRHKKRAHAGTAPGAGALATGRRGLPSVETRIFTATPSWRPPGS